MSIIISYSDSRFVICHPAFCLIKTLLQIYPDEAHGLYGVIKHEHQTMEAFLDDVYGPIEDFFENDYYLAAAKLLEKYAPNGGAH